MSPTRPLLHRLSHLHHHHHIHLLHRLPRRIMASLPRTPLFEALSAHKPNSTAIIHSGSKKEYSFATLLHDVAATRRILLQRRNNEDLKMDRVAMLVENSYEYVVSFLSVIAAGGIVVPLCTAHPKAEQAYVIENSTPTMLLATKMFEERAGQLVEGAKGTSLLTLPEYTPSNNDTAPLPELVPASFDSSSTGAYIIYTSGTTGRPKGALHTHASLHAQTHSLSTAWGLSAVDTVLHVLPLHHVHGIIAALLAPLSAGAAVRFLYPFDPAPVWAALQHASVFMAVPTIYSRLLASPILTPTEKTHTVQHLRLAISGSAALPTPVRDGWAALGGDLLERYGMTETGLTLSHTLSSRPTNSVGWPLPGVDVRLTADSHEIQVRGPTLFSGYWGDPSATSASFTPDGWFRTGDMGRVGTRGEYTIEGRHSTDIIKSGGEKVSALEVERVMLGLASVAEVAVVGIHSQEWGQRVAAVVVLSGACKSWDVADMREEMKKLVAAYKVPTVMKVVKELPRNVMGKVNKKELVKVVFGK